MRLMRRLGVLVVCAGFALGCNLSSGASDDDNLVSEQFAAAGAIVQSHGDNKVAFTVDDDGKIKAGVKNKSGEAVTSNINGKVSWTDDDGEKQTANLKLNKKTGLLEAKKPLPPTAKNVDYQLSIKGDDVEGDLEVPKKEDTAVAEEAEEAEVDDPVAQKPTFNLKTAPTTPVTDKKAVNDTSSGWTTKKAEDEKKKSAWEKKKAAEEKKKSAWEKKKAAEEKKKSAWEKKKADAKKSAWEKKKADAQKSAWEKKKEDAKKKAAWEKKAEEEKKKAAWEKKKAAEPKKSY